MIDEQAQIDATVDGGAVTVTGTGLLNFMNAKEFGERLREAAMSADSVCADLRGAHFIDTQIVQDLAVAAVKLLDRGKRLRVMVLEAKHPLRVLQISGFEGIMDIEVQRVGKQEP